MPSGTDVTAADEWDARRLLHVLLELPRDELAAFTRYLESQSRSHEAEVSDPAGISDEVRVEQIATGTGHGIARMTGTGTGYAVHAEPPEPTTPATLWEDIRPRDPEQATAYLQTLLPLLRLLMFFLMGAGTVGAATASDEVRQVLLDALRALPSASAPEAPPPSAPEPSGSEPPPPAEAPR